MSVEREIPADAPAPRLCHLVKWPDFDGYGFNLHAEKSRAGQYIGKVDENSPAETAGMKEGDRIIEVNGVNIANENHRQVVERIKALPSETRLLVVDEQADRYYKERKLVVKSTQSNVIYIKTPERSPTESASTPNINQITPSPKSSPNVNGMKYGAPKGSPKIEKINGAPRTDSPKSLPKENGEEKSPQSNRNVEDSPQVIRGSESDSLHGEKGVSSRSSTPQGGSTSGSVPDSPHSTKSYHSQNGPSMTKSGGSNPGDLNLNMSASEMRQLLASRKKHDPKKTQMDLRQKYDIIQQM